MRAMQVLYRLLAELFMIKQPSDWLLVLAVLAGAVAVGWLGP